jgi:hypothetical protein
VHIFDKARTSTSPSEFLLGIVKPEVAYLIFDIVVHEKFTNLVDLIIIVDIEGSPLKSWRQSRRLCWNILRLELLDLAFLGWFPILHDGLSIPKLVIPHHIQNLLKSIPLEEVDIVVR